MSEYNNTQSYMHPNQGYGHTAAFSPDRVGSGGLAAPQPIAAGKRPRRLRSVQGAAHYGNGQKGKKGPGSNSQNKVQYHDRRTAAPIFLQKTFEMINRCHSQHSHLAGWTEDGNMFVIKDQAVFAKDIIPQFFDHNKFTSFARQLNFYGFRKMQSRAIYKGDVNKETAKYVTFFNEKFKRDRPDLLKEIQRSTKGGQSANQSQEQQREIKSLKERVTQLEQTIHMMQSDFNERFAALQTQMYQYSTYSNGQHAMSYPSNAGETYNENYNQGDGTLPSPEKIDTETENDTSQPTLAPHPNSKVLPDSRVLPAPPRQGSNMRYDSFLRGLSSASIPDMTPFEQKYLQNAMTGPDPLNSDSNTNQSPAASLSTGTAGDELALPQLNQNNRSGLTRQLSEGFQRLDLSLSEYPPLGSVPM